MKRAIELMGTDYSARSEILASDTKPVGLVEYQLTETQLEALVRRVREEMNEACALEADRMDVDTYELKGGGNFAAQSARPADEIAEAIRALLVRP